MVRRTYQDLSVASSCVAGQLFIVWDPSRRPSALLLALTACRPSSGLRLRPSRTTPWSTNQGTCHEEDVMRKNLAFVSSRKIRMRRSPPAQRRVSESEGCLKRSHTDALTTPNRGSCCGRAAPAPAPPNARARPAPRRACGFPRQPSPPAHARPVRPRAFAAPWPPDPAAL